MPAPMPSQGNTKNLALHHTLMDSSGFLRIGGQGVRHSIHGPRSMSGVPPNSCGVRVEEWNVAGRGAQSIESEGGMLCPVHGDLRILAYILLASGGVVS